MVILPVIDQNKNFPGIPFKDLITQKKKQENKPNYLLAPKKHLKLHIPSRRLDTPFSPCEVCPPAFRKYNRPLMKN